MAVITRRELVSQMQEEVSLLSSDLDQTDYTPFGDLPKLLDRMAARTRHIDRYVETLAAMEAAEVS
jgi:hypothetical protein